MLKKVIGSVIKELRNERSLSQEKLAEKSDLDRVFISYIENGHRQPTIVTLFKLAEGLDVEPEEIVGKIKQLYRKES